MGSIEQNVARIREEISAAAAKNGRSAADITLVGVTKSVDANIIRELLAAGVSNIGENRVQDFLPKFEKLPMANWHFIGHLQRNKVKYIIDKVSLIHSVDNFGLAQEIDKRAAQIGRQADILMEINIANEISKYGVAPAEAVAFATELANLKNIRLRGLMCIAPFTEDPETNRPHFKNMRDIFVDINSLHKHNLTELSMGMSGDYAVAIEEGATMVRIGTALVGV